MTIPQIYDSKPKAEYPKSAFIDYCLELLVKAEQEDEDWKVTETKAPTRDTVMNWCTGATKPTNPLYLKALSIGLNIPINKLF